MLTGGRDGLCAWCASESRISGNSQDPCSGNPLVAGSSPARPTRDRFSRSPILSRGLHRCTDCAVQQAMDGNRSPTAGAFDDVIPSMRESLENKRRRTRIAQARPQDHSVVRGITECGYGSRMRLLVTFKFWA